MERNTELLLTEAGQHTRSADEEKAANDVEELRMEFRGRLVGNDRSRRTRLLSRRW
jgi:hypothetical protein